MRKSAAFAAALLAACTTPPPEQDELPGDPVALAMDGCTALSLRDFGPGIAIRSANRVPAGGTASGTNSTLPAHCRVEGVIDERTGEGGKTYGIGFAIALPDQWSGRFLLRGARSEQNGGDGGKFPQGNPLHAVRANSNIRPPDPRNAFPTQACIGQTTEDDGQASHYAGVFKDSAQ